VSGAIFSKCRRYRYRLWRDLPGVVGSTKEAAYFIMLNPSTADEHVDDPTIRRCMGFASRWGYRRLEVLNLSPIRATSPKDLMRMMSEWQAPEDVRNMNIVEQVLDCINEPDSIVVAAWGAHVVECELETMAERVTEMCDDLHVLGLTKHGHPRHPLYMPRDTKPMRWER